MVGTGGIGKEVGIRCSKGGQVSQRAVLCGVG